MDVDVWQESGWSPEAEEAPADEDESEEMERLWSGPSVPPLDLLSESHARLPTCLSYLTSRTSAVLRRPRV